MSVTRSMPALTPFIATLPMLALRGRGVACALGVGMPTSLAGLIQPPTKPAVIAVGDQAYLYRPIDDRLGAPAPTDAAAWLERCVRLVASSLAEAGAGADEVLVVASSSFDMGMLERGGAWYGDGFGFVDELARRLAWRGPVLALNTACTSSFQALALAQELIAAQAGTAVNVLGLELHNRYAVSGFAAMQLVDPWQVDTPWEGRMVLGEAVAVLRVADASRPHVVPGDRTGWRLTGLAHAVCGTDPGGTTPEVLRRVIDEALTQAGLGADGIDLLRCHATGRAGSDVAEFAVLDAVFTHRPPRVGLKAHLGHTQGASGAVELALLTGAIDGGCPVPDGRGSMSTVRRERGCRMLAVGLGFGGSHAALVLERAGVGRGGAT